MPSSAPYDFIEALQQFAVQLTNTFQSAGSFQPEDQLKAPVATLLKAAGAVVDVQVATVTEAHSDDISGRPDIGVSVDHLLCGYVELKAPGKGARIDKLPKRDKLQWTVGFKDLPNLIYTDGNEWGLYRAGERVGKIIRLAGDVTEDGAAAVTAKNAEALLDTLRDFLIWQPIVPVSPKGLADVLAPLCRLLRRDVITALADDSSNLTTLREDWRQHLFPDTDNWQFADAYAQTVTYALLLARLSGSDTVTIPEASKVIKKGHQFLADALRILGDENARTELTLPIDLLERVLSALDVPALLAKSHGDPWLYFYEDFLAAYDPAMRRDRGVYYTPVPVIQCQVRLVTQLLASAFGAPFGFADPKVRTLDPAAGTGTYLLTALKLTLDRVEASHGAGIRATAATTAANNMHGFELLVGPYTVGHLRITQQILEEGGSLPSDGVKMYLTDTLESPHAEPPKHLPLSLKPLGEEHKRAQKVKATVPVLVCIGNPPYDRQEIDHEESDNVSRKGGWIRYGDGEEDEPLLQDFIKPLGTAGAVHAKSLYNDYVYFWRWALWKVFEKDSALDKPETAGIVSFITASSYLRGPGFAGMRQVMRERFDEIWFIDLEGGSLGARKTENVFAIRTPVAIAVGVRYGQSSPTAAKAHYCVIAGTQTEKFDRLATVHTFDDLSFDECLSDWSDPFLPPLPEPYCKWPLLTDLFPWQESGMQFKRSWPIGETASLLQRRWKALLESQSRRSLFRETRDRVIAGSYRDLKNPGERLTPIERLKANASMPEAVPIAYRTFDRRLALLDNRLGDFLRPAMQRSYGDNQIFMTGFFTEVLGEGPAAVATDLLPDLHHFRGSFGGKHIIPLWRDSGATTANITLGLLEKLPYGHAVNAEDFLAYTYAVLASPSYTQRFWAELKHPPPRIPITKDHSLFLEVVALGKRAIWLHTFGNRMVPEGMTKGVVPAGRAKCLHGTSSDATKYPTTMTYDAEDEVLMIGDGMFAQVSPGVLSFDVSGYPVVYAWVDARFQARPGRKTSELDVLRPDQWTFDAELLNLLWVIEHTVALHDEVAKTLDRVIGGPLIDATDLPTPSAAERQSPEAGDLSEEVIDLFE